jgi:hypothetical protein
VSTTDTPTVIGLSVNELAAALSSLAGSRVTDVGRTAHLMEIGFDQGGARHILSAYCPLRAVRGERILLGAADMNYPENRSMDPEEAFQTGTTMYDRNAKWLTDRLATSDVRVLSAEVDAAGAVGIEATGHLWFEVMPASARRLEAWHLVVDGRRYTYPGPAAAE